MLLASTVILLSRKDAWRIDSVDSDAKQHGQASGFDQIPPVIVHLALKTSISGSARAGKAVQNDGTTARLKCQRYLTLPIHHGPEKPTWN
jgi:hypothetical protein